VLSAGSCLLEQLRCNERSRGNVHWVTTIALAYPKCYHRAYDAISLGSIGRLTTRDHQGTPNVEDHETRRKVIRQWMSLPKDKRHSTEQAAEFAKKTVEQNEFQASRRDPYERVMGWLLPRTGK
jgi:hypothetical protein